MPKHAGRHSFDSAPRSGNAANFIGAAQVTMGLAGRACLDGDRSNGRLLRPRNQRRRARGELNRRGVRLRGESDGIKTTMVEPYVPTLAGDGGLTAE